MYNSSVKDVAARTQKSKTGQSSEETKDQTSSTTASSMEENKRFICYLANISLTLSQYEVHITKDNLTVISVSKKRVKLTLQT